MPAWDGIGFVENDYARNIRCMEGFENAVNNAHLLFVIRTGNINNLKDQIGV